MPETWSRNTAVICEKFETCTQTSLNSGLLTVSEIFSTRTLVCHTLRAAKCCEELVARCTTSHISVSPFKLNGSWFSVRSRCPQTEWLTLQLYTWRACRCSVKLHQKMTSIAVVSNFPRLSGLVALRCTCLVVNWWWGVRVSNIL